MPLPLGPPPRAVALPRVAAPTQYLYSSLAGAALEALGAIHAGRAPLTLSGRQSCFTRWGSWSSVPTGSAAL